MVEILKRTDGVPEKIESIIISAVEKTLELLDRSGDVTVAIVDNEQIRGMNAEYRDKDVPTAVLSFPSYPMNFWAILPYPMSVPLSRRGITDTPLSVRRRFWQHTGRFIFSATTIYMRRTSVKC